MKYMFIPFLFGVININILHCKLCQTSNSLTRKKPKWILFICKTLYLQDGGGMN
jgi:hypothetical protein